MRLRVLRLYSTRGPLTIPLPALLKSRGEQAYGAKIRFCDYERGDRPHA